MADLLESLKQGLNFIKISNKTKEGLTNNCVDNNAAVATATSNQVADCAAGAALGGCTHDLYGQHMRQACPVTCNTCPPAPTTTTSGNSVVQQSPGIDEKLKLYSDKFDTISTNWDNSKQKASDGYQLFFCLDKDGSIKNNGDNIFNDAGTNIGTCQKPKLNLLKLNKILKTSDGTLYYVNKYGYIKQIGDSSNSKDATCDSITTEDIGTTSIDDFVKTGTNEETLFKSKQLGLTSTQLKNINSVLKQCTDGHYNLKDSAGNMAYLAPNGQLIKYGAKWEIKNSEGKAVGGAKKTPCGVLSTQTVNKPFNNVEDGHRFDGAGAAGDFLVEGVGTGKAFENINSQTISDKASSIANCFPYLYDDGFQLSTYKNNLKKKLEGELSVLTTQKDFVELINEYTTLKKDYIQPALESEIDGGHANANEYNKQIIELKKKMEKFESSDQYQDYVLKIRSSNFQRILWLSAAVLLGAIAIKQIKSI